MLTTESYAPEVAAIGVVLEALEPLTGPARERVLEYVTNALGVVRAPVVPVMSTPAAPATVDTVAPPPAAAAPNVVDIRALKEAKAPSSANEMAAVAAYYLREHAPADERSDTIDTATVQKLFKQAGYPLPTRIDKTLSNAAAAGYFDQAGADMVSIARSPTDLVRAIPLSTNSQATPPSRSATTSNGPFVRGLYGAKATA